MSGKAEQKNQGSKVQGESDRCKSWQVLIPPTKFHLHTLVHMHTTTYHAMCLLDSL